MKLYEYQGKELFSKYGIPIPKGRIISSAEENMDDLPNDVIVKAQVLRGGRGKAGLIKCTDKNGVAETFDAISKKADKVLVEEKIDIKKEMYLSLTINRTDRNISLIFCEEGGVEIEELSKTNPEKIVKISLNDYDEEKIKKELPKEQYAGLLPIISKLYKIMKDFDAELVEINPLVLSKENNLIAADAKVIIDDNALFRHPEFLECKNEQLSDIEKKAAEHSLQYVELDGNIAVIGNGAGLVMATLDSLNYFGGKPANFLDVGGGASVDVMETSLEIVLLKKPRGIFINIFGGITRCDDIANGIVNYVKKEDIKIPFVVRMIGTNEEEGKKILRESGIESLDSMDACAEKIVELTK